jgi:hypothetical protein
VSPALRRALLLAAVAALAVACSSLTRVAYNNAPFAATWMVDDWFDLHEGQREWVKGRLELYVAWHRASELPAYEKLLQDTAARAATRLTEEDMRRAWREMRALYQRAVRQAIPDMADFLRQVRPEQVEHLERRFAEDNEKMIKESLRGTPRERREARAKRYVERIDDWTGRLTAAQRDLVGAHVAAMDDLAEEWMGDRRFRQSETLGLLRSRPSRDGLIAGLTRILIDSDSWRRPEYVAKLRARDEKVIAMLAALDATLTGEQRSKLHRKLGGYAADVAYLMVAN